MAEGDEDEEEVVVGVGEEVEDAVVPLYRIMSLPDLFCMVKTNVTWCILCL